MAPQLENFRWVLIQQMALDQALLGVNQFLINMNYILLAIDENDL